MSSKFDTNDEPLPGYRLVKHLGSGGYGEVWSVEAPGGLLKAIKFVFGSHHEKRASHELAALERVRTVRHPFLLSLERIEVVDGRLLVVTELADGSLKDRFDECRRHGQAGIPRQELIRYLCDAADALDFMNTAHALGHLDVKPENLLLLAGHVKVADFGLVKDVRQSQASLVGGMTPLYAAPEVFRGHPGSQSDQYSLAIVYLEMLTGSLPFRAGSAAEMTLQHLNDEPDLSTLPDGDRYVLSRSLAKDPAHRYESCRAFIDALGNVNNETALRGSVSEKSPAAPVSFADPRACAESGVSAACPTDVFDTDDGDHGFDAASMLIGSSARQSELTDLPPVEIDPAAAELTPTLIVGIGGSAGRVLAHFHNLVRSQSPSAGGIPAIQTLLLDTDARAAAEATRGERDGLAPDDVLTLPLERPQHYREHSQQLLRWLSRRWLYNIPKSLRTEGLRPLGRLALTNHARQVGLRLRRGITQAIDAPAVEKSAAALGQEFRRDVARVFVVASISGGTGSGMSLDIGYAARSILEKLSLAGSQIIGIMLHATGGDPRHCELARVNAFSWLTEFHHFNQPNAAYPGDASCGFPAHVPGVRPFDETYLVHLGDQLDSCDFDAATLAVAEYLRLNTLTPAKAFFDSHRASTHVAAGSSGASAPAPLRSFGLLRRTAVAAGDCDDVAAAIAARVIAHWQQGRSNPLDKKSGENGPHDSAEMQFARRLRLDADGVIGNMRALAELQLGADVPSFVSGLWATSGDARHDRSGNWLPTIDRVFRHPDGEAANAPGWLLGRPVASVVEPLTEKLRMEVRKWLMGRFDDSHGRLAGSRRSAEWLTSHLASMDEALGQLAHTKSARVSQIQASAQNSPAYSANQPMDYCATRLDLLAAQAAGHATRLLLADAKSLADELLSLGRELEHIARGVPRPESADASRNVTLHAMAPQLDELASEVDRRLANELLAEQGLWDTVMQGGRRRAQLCAALNEFARESALRALENRSPLDGELAAGGENSDLGSQVAAATPSLLAQGGSRRVLVILPNADAGDHAARKLAAQLRLAPNLMSGSDQNSTLCVEASGLPVSDVAVEFVQRRRDRVEFAGRVQCRSDVAWTPLFVEPVEAPMSTWVELDHSAVLPDEFEAKTMVLQQ